MYSILSTKIAQIFKSVVLHTEVLRLVIESP